MKNGLQARNVVFIIMFQRWKNVLASRRLSSFRLRQPLEPFWNRHDGLMMLGSIGSLARLLVGIEAWGLEIIGARSHTISIYHVAAAAAAAWNCATMLPAAWLLYTIIIIVIMVLHYFSIVCQQRSRARKKCSKTGVPTIFFVSSEVRSKSHVFFHSSA